MSHRNAAVLLFARAPVLGRVKTRLVPPLTPEEALRFHIACVEVSARLLARLPSSLEKYIYVAGSTGPAARRLLRRLRLPRALRPGRQVGRNLGERLWGAFQERFRAGALRVVIIGSDSPTLPAARIRQALGALRRADVVLGPAADGGYYLIGARAETQGLPELSSGIEWSTERTFQQTRVRLRRAGHRLALLPQWHDVDTPGDFLQLQRDLNRVRGTHLRPLREFLRSLARGNHPMLIDQSSRS